MPRVVWNPFLPAVALLLVYPSVPTCTDEGLVREVHVGREPGSTIRTAFVCRQLGKLLHLLDELLLLFFLHGRRQLTWARWMAKHGAGEASPEK